MAIEDMVTGKDSACSCCDRHVLVYDLLDLSDWILNTPKPEYKGMGANIHYEKYQRMKSIAIKTQLKFNKKGK